MACLVCLPPHSTDRMQPLDVSFMFPLKTFYAQEIENWLTNHPGRVVTHYQVGEIFGKAYAKACKIDTAVNGFRKTGIFPLNENIFCDSPNAPPSTDVNSTTSLVNVVSLPFNSTRPRTPTPLLELSNSSSPFIVPADVQPIPVVEPPSTSTRRGKAMVVTASPHKQEIIDVEKKRKEKDERQQNATGKREAGKKSQKCKEKYDRKQQEEN